MPLLDVSELHVQYKKNNEEIFAVNGVSFELNEESIVGVLGESGSGKSTVAQSVVDILPSNATIPKGAIRFGGKNTLEMTEKELKQLRWSNIAYIPQSAMGSLDPISTIQDQLLDVVSEHTDMSKDEALSRASEVLETVGIPDSRLSNYPHQLSGGMRQRIMIAMGLILKPEIIIADEPTTGVDVITRDKILDDLETYREEFGISILMISHDVADLVETCDSLLVMYGGKIVEKGPSNTVFSEPEHPYTLMLKEVLPQIGDSYEDIPSLNIDPPENRSPVDQCVFYNKCPFAIAKCEGPHPQMKTKNTNDVACYRSNESERFRAQIQEIMD